MEAKKPTTGKFGLIYGTVAAIIGIVFTFMLMASDLLFDPSPVKSIVQVIIFIFIVILAIYNFKKNNDNYLSLGQSLAIGAIVAVVTSIIGLIFMYCLTTFIVPDFWAQNAEVSRAIMIENNPSISPKELENMLEMQSKFNWIIYPAMLVMNLVVGFFTALITGLILKKTENLY
ncbi:DUF4199 domain-containing protein [Cellulophaga sp. Asnod2-G02]|uniref:DUF4199 domain-containing protein n=1 Tax=Cellulophaga sp. Asnod2-G02 TaxID=3160572 RepID=UPI003868E915